MPIGETRNPVTIIILTLVTCGLYGLYWFYLVSKEINAALGEERIQFVLYFLVGILCFPLIFVGMYKIDDALVELQSRVGIQGKSNFVLWIILSFLGGVGTYVMEYQVQEALNEVWARS